MSRNTDHKHNPDTVIAQELARARQRRLRHNEKDLTEGPVANSHRYMSSLPHELLLHIFRETVPPLHQYDPSLIQGPRNPWLTALRTRKALVVTCKAFFGPAMEVLYEDIVIRRMGQIPALARTLGPHASDSGLDVATMIRRLRMDGCVVWAACADVVREDLRLILQRCTALRSFSFHPHPHFPFRSEGDLDNYTDGFNPSWLIEPDPNHDSVGGALRERLSSNLHLFDLAIELDESILVSLHGFLSSVSQLKVLKLGRVEDGEYSDKLLSLPLLSIPSLKELQLYATHSPFQYYISQRWQLPLLQHLTATCCEQFPENLLRAHGAHLTYFHMRHHDRFAWGIPELEPLSRLGSLCPEIEHLVIPTWIRDPLVINSPTLRFVDVWGHHPPPYIFKQGWYQLCRTSVLPNFHRVRILSAMPRTLWRSMQCLDWPLICHPSVVSGEEQRVYSFPGVRVVQTAWGVLHDYDDEDLTWGGVDGVGRRDNSGLYQDEDEEDTTSVISEGTDEPESDTSYYVAEQEIEDLSNAEGRHIRVDQYSRDMILDMFQHSQERRFLFDDE